jgi:hypothetical protein
VLSDGGLFPKDHCTFHFDNPAILSGLFDSSLPQVIIENSDRVYRAGRLVPVFVDRFKVRESFHSTVL